MSVEQSGLVTPGHLTAWTTDGVVQDAGFLYSNSYGLLANIVQNINFNSANTDNPIPINLPAGYTKYFIDLILIYGATTSLSTATCGIFTAQAAGGTAVVTTGTAITVTQTAGDTNENMQSLTINDKTTMFFIDPVLYFRVQNAQGVAALGNVAVFYRPLP
jgi:hypothetical protein